MLFKEEYFSPKKDNNFSGFRHSKCFVLFRVMVDTIPLLVSFSRMSYVVVLSIFASFDICSAVRRAPLSRARYIFISLDSNPRLPNTEVICFCMIVVVLDYL